MGIPKVNGIAQILDGFAPRKLAESWDNVGLLLGDGSRKVKSIMVCLDTPEWVVEEAINKKVDMIICHHPLIFNPIKRITNDNPIGRKIIKLIKNNIAVYAMHTNFDSSAGGMNDILMERLGFGKSEILETKSHPYEEVVCDIVSLENKQENYGLGRIGELEDAVTLQEYAERVKNLLCIKSLKIIGNGEKIIKKVAVIGGAGSSYWQKAKSKGADVLITGDISYHTQVDALEGGIALIDGGHFGTEKVIMSFMTEKLKELLREKGYKDVLIEASIENNEKETTM